MALAQENRIIDMLNKTRLSFVIAALVASSVSMAVETKSVTATAAKVDATAKQVMTEKPKVDVADEKAKMTTALDVIITKVMNDAKTDQKKAASVGGEWRDIGKMLKKAQKAKDSKNFVKAFELAQIASEQAKIGYKQAMDQQVFKAPSYLKY